MMDLYALRILMIKLKRKLCKKKENILFLDIDGVLCPTNSVDLNAYSKESIALVNKLINGHHLKVVLCSGRRQSERMLSLTVKGLKKAGLKELPETDVLLEGRWPGHHDYDANRSDDIVSYIERNPTKGRILIIDDEKRLYENALGLDSFLIIPNNPKIGFTEDDFRRAESFLNNGFEKSYRLWGTLKERKRF